MADAGARERFHDLVVRYQDVVCAVAYSVLRDRARSEEVAQDAFLVAWTKAAPPTAGWICGVARNLARNAARKRSEDRMDDSTTTALTARDATPLDALLSREAIELANRALATLPDADREVVVLYYRGDQSLGEVATALGISEVAARQRLHRGRERLRAALAQVEAMLRGTRPGPAFTAACVAAMLGGAKVSAASAAVATSSKTAGAGASAIAIPVLAIGAIAIGVWALARGGGSPAAAPAPAAAATEKVVPAVADEPSAAGAPTAKPKPAATVPIRRITPEMRADLVRRITAARTAREAATGTSPTTTTAPPALELARTGLTKEDIKAAVQAVAPLLLECYTAEMDHLANPDGRMVVKLQLTGEAEVGTVVDTTGVDGDANLTANHELTECIGATLSSIELPPLVEGGSVTVNYPIVFQRDTDPPTGSADR